MILFVIILMGNNTAADAVFNITRKLCNTFFEVASLFLLYIIKEISESKRIHYVSWKGTVFHTDSIKKAAGIRTTETLVIKEASRRDDGRMGIPHKPHSQKGHVCMVNYFLNSVIVFGNNVV